MLTSWIRAWYRSEISGPSSPMMGKGGDNRKSTSFLLLVCGLYVIFHHKHNHHLPSIDELNLLINFFLWISLVTIKFIVANLDNICIFSFILFSLIPLIVERFFPNWRPGWYSKSKDFFEKYAGLRNFIKNSLFIIILAYICCKISSLDNVKLLLFLADYSYILPIVTIIGLYGAAFILKGSIINRAQELWNMIKKVNFSQIFIDRIFFLWSINSTNFLLLSLLTFLSDTCVANIFDFNNLIHILSFNILSILSVCVCPVSLSNDNFILNCSPPVNQIVESVEEYRKKYIVTWLQNNLSKSYEFIISKFDLTPNNVKVLLNVLDLSGMVDYNYYNSQGWLSYTKDSPPFYGFLKGDGNTNFSLVPERNLKFTLPSNNSRIGAHLFSEVQINILNSNDQNQSISWPSMESFIMNFIQNNYNTENGVFLLDKNSGQLFKLNNSYSSDLLDCNEILYVKFRNKIMVPYDPLVKSYWGKDLYIKDQSSQFHLIGGDYKTRNPVLNGVRLSSSLSNFSILTFSLANSRVEVAGDTLIHILALKTVKSAVLGSHACNRFL